MVNLKTPPTLIFDFDGTMADTFDLIITGLNHYSDKFGYEKLTPETTKILRELPARELLRMSPVKWHQLPRLISKLRQYVKSEIHQVQLQAGILQMINQFKSNGSVMGIVTSNSVENVKLLLQDKHCSDFDFIHSSSKIFGKAKSLQKVIKQWKLNKSQVYYVGDETRDVEAAKASGVKSIAVSWGFNSKALLQRASPDFLVDSPAELSAIFQ